MLTDNEKLALELGLDLTLLLETQRLYYDTPKNLMEGNYLDAGLAAASSIPFLGAPADATRAARKEPIIYKTKRLKKHNEVTQ